MLRSLCILRILCRTESPVNESFVQNSMFLLQEALGEELESSFYLDLYGPRSREVFENLIALEQEGRIVISGDRQGVVVAVTENGRRFINQGGKWGPFFDVPPVRIPEALIDSIFTLLNREMPLDMEALGTALYFALSAENTGSLQTELEKATVEGKLAEELLERVIVEAYRRLKRFGIRLAK
jgi:hypothetical protein